MGDAVNALPLSWFVDRLNRKERFGFSRYGDGEWLCILGAEGETADHHPYSPELGADLRRTLAAPGEYQYAMGPKAISGNGPEVMKWLFENAPSINWVSTETFLEASLRGQLRPFVEALDKLKCMVVGPAHLSGLRHPDANIFIEIPAINCYVEKESIERDIIAYAPGCDVILLSAGMISNVLIYDLYPNLAQTIIDIGSLWDMYCGVPSRRYACKMSAGVKARLKKANGL
jgi:hypothetical protein